MNGVERNELYLKGILQGEGLFPHLEAAPAPWIQVTLAQESSTIIRAPFSAIIAVGVFVFPDVIVGMTEASTTRRRSMPWTRRRASTTASVSVAGPIFAVPTG